LAAIFISFPGWRPPAVSSLAKQFRNQENQNGPAESAAQQQINQRVSDCSYDWCHDVPSFLIFRFRSIQRFCQLAKSGFKGFRE
jgi:hypothetical protein